MTQQADRKGKPGVLVLEDRNNPEGLEYPGYLFGAPVDAASLTARKDQGYGEVVFNTSMTGYQEILTDPSYYGQIVCMTVPHVGNTGVNNQDPESSRAWCAGFVVHEFCDQPSNWRSQSSLDEYLRQNGIPGIHGIDTRALTRHLRSMGVVRGVILPRSDRSQAKRLLEDLPPFEGRDLIHEVSTPKSYSWKPSPTQAKYKVVALDFGAKWNLLRSLSQLGCDVEVVPAKTSAKEILARSPDGVFLSNGPGDPAAAPYAAQTVKELVGKVPIFGVCMGHQILALAMGAKTYKLKFGHRGGNQPVLDRTTQRVEISSHNHGYAVDGSSLPKDIEVTHINLNDRTIEGLCVKDAKAFSVQYHPEACPGPHDSMILFERFIDSMRAR
jgi:carbamoyl-phosphate synthase small subunit